jgi:inosine-uridine nucleoside N-ribohydrolase
MCDTHHNHLPPIVTTCRVGILRCLPHSEGRGNASFSAEFNFWADPEAASKVLAAFSTSETAAPIDLVTWETCLKHQMTWDFFDRLTCSDQQPSSCLRKVCAAYEAAERMATTQEGM